MIPRRFASGLLLAAASAVSFLGCAGDDTAGEHRGFILISLSGLRADALGFQGRQPSPSPFLDSLAERAQVYEHALTTSPDSLVAHVSMLSGLYPAEHGVVPPEGTLVAEVPVLPERFSAYGYRTAGFTDGGYLSSDFGFDRGFDRFETATSDGKSSFDRSIDYLRTVRDEPFFLFVHSDALEDALGVDSRIDLGRLVAGNDDLTDEVLGRMKASYLEAVTRLDREVERLVAEIEAQGLQGETVVAITADHGFEFGEHGRLGHKQVYPETLGVPLLVLVPGLEPRRSRTLVQTVDIAPSFYSVAGLPMPRISGRTLPGIRGAAGSRQWAVAQARGRWTQETLVLEIEGGLYQSVASKLRGEHDGTWVTRAVSFDTIASALDFSIVSFLVPRSVRVSVGGGGESTIEVGSRWGARTLPLGPGPKRLTFSAEDCSSPSDVGAGSDRRCLSFKVRGLDLSRSELFDLREDPGALLDVSADRPAVAALLRSLLSQHRWQAVASPLSTQPGAATVRAITARAEYPESPRP